MASEPVRESIIPAQENRGSDTHSSSTTAASLQKGWQGNGGSERGKEVKNERSSEAWDAEDGAPEEIVAISREEAERLFGPDVSRPSRVTPMRVVGAQCLVTVCSMLVCGVLSQSAMVAALSALIGGVICWVPSAVFAMQLKARARTSMGAWMLAEGIKLGLTIAMFIIVAVYFKDVRWLPLLVTYVLALKTYWLALAWK